MLESIQPKTRIEIIDYVVSHFEKNPRSLSSHGCLYNGPNGAMCGFAILCANPEKLIEDWSPISLIQNGKAILKPEFSGQSGDFYCDIQMLHDNRGYWKITPEGNELTQIGIERVEELKEKHK